MNAPIPAQALAVSFELDGSACEALAGETIYQAARRAGVDIPTLCYKDGYRPDGNCRACMVEIEGERVLAPSCCRAPKPGMKVKVDSERAVAARRLVLELLMADAPANEQRVDSELTTWAAREGVLTSRFNQRAETPCDFSHPGIAVNLDACIQCGRCVRACREEQVNDVIGYAWRGDAAKIVFDMDDPMGVSTCVACGECVQACPTGALMPKLLGSNEVAPREVEKKVDSLCPFCGVGCQLTYNITDNRIIFVDGRDGPSNHSRLCVKGRYGFDYAMSPDRLTVPLIRKDSHPKDPTFDRVPADWRNSFREATWEEALDRAGFGLATIRDEHGPKSLAGFGSAKGSNEEAYLFQKLVRTGFGCNNVDHCTRLCHASSVAALLEGIGSGAVSNQVSDVQFSEVIFVVGANPTANHPVAATWIKNAVKRGASLIVADPRRTDLARHAAHVLQFKADSDVALFNALIHTVIDEGLADRRFIEERTLNFEAIRDNVAACSPEAMAGICGVTAEEIREVARLYARSRASIIFWGMGVSQHVHGTDNVRCLITLSLITGQIGRAGTGLHPLRGQNNVQGASDAGLIPMMYPDYRRVDELDAIARFEKLWNTPLDHEPGLTVVEIMDAATRGEIRGMYIMGENPAMSDPDLHHARQALAGLDLLVVQDIFPTETAWLADVILPASAFPEKTGTFTNTDRMVQLARKALDPPGQARQDLWIINQLARRLGLDWNYDDPRPVFEEMRSSMDSIAGISWDRMIAQGSVTYPCADDDDPGQPVVFIDRFPTMTGKASLVPAGLISADERPDADYPFVLITGRQLEHWHTGAMTRRSYVLDAIEPEATVAMHGDELRRLGLEPGGLVTVASRRGAIRLRVRADDGIARGSVFIPFAYAEAAANQLTNPKLDPYGKIPEFKYCAVKVTADRPDDDGSRGATSH